MGLILCQIAHILGGLLQAYDTLLTLYLIYPDSLKIVVGLTQNMESFGRNVRKQRAIKFRLYRRTYILIEMLRSFFLFFCFYAFMHPYKRHVCHLLNHYCVYCFKSPSLTSMVRYAPPWTTNVTSTDLTNNLYLNFIGNLVFISYAHMF